MTFYIATSLSNAEAHNVVRDRLVRLGHEITYDWTEHGPAPERMAEVAALECGGVCRADFLVVLLPGGRGTHTELGMAWGMGKRIFLHGPRADEASGLECAFYHGDGSYHEDAMVQAPRISHHEGSLADLVIDVQEWAQEGRR